MTYDPREYFKRFDWNGNMRLGYEEYASAYRYADGEASDAKVMTTFKWTDCNNNGDLSPAELIRAWWYWTVPCEEAGLDIDAYDYHRRFDWDGDGQLSENEWIAGHREADPTVTDEDEMMMNMMWTDCDGNGTISPDELANMHAMVNCMGEIAREDDMENMKKMKKRMGMGKGGRGGNGMMDMSEDKDRLIMTGADGSMMYLEMGATKIAATAAAALGLMTLF